MDSSSGLQELSWCWQGHTIRYTVFQPDHPNGPLPRRAVLCIHGFGASKGHWRHTLPTLGRSIPTYAIDLLGFGASSKPVSCLTDEPLVPGGVRYGFDLWAQLVVDFCHEVLGGCDLQLIGNSIGGVVALNAARLLTQQGHPPKQVILLDCAQRELDLKRLAEQPPLARAGRPALMALVRQRWLVSSLFRLLARPAVVRRVLHRAYPSRQNVDNDLVELLLRPSRDPGAAESFRGFVNLFDDWLAPQLLAGMTIPVRMIWGEADPWEPLQEALLWQRSFDCIQDLQVLKGIGHCPHDEDPARVNPLLLHWLELGWAAGAEPNP